MACLESGPVGQYRPFTIFVLCKQSSNTENLIKHLQKNMCLKDNKQM